MTKPNADIYLYALKKIHSKPQETLFVDDGEENVEAARKIGLKGYVYSDYNSFIKDNNL